jgi:hypothetical protein
MSLRLFLWSPFMAAIAAGLLFLVGAISDWMVVAICSIGWLPWWIAAMVLVWRSGFSATPEVRKLMRSLLIASVFSYGVIWGVSLMP